MLSRGNNRKMTPQCVAKSWDGHTVTGFTTRGLVKKRNVKQSYKTIWHVSGEIINYVEKRLTYMLSWIGVPRRQTRRPRFTCRMFTGESSQEQHWWGEWGSTSGHEVYCDAGASGGSSRAGTALQSCPELRQGCYLCLCIAHQSNVGCRLPPGWEPNLGRSINFIEKATV